MLKKRCDMRDLSQYDGLRPLIQTGDLVEWCGNGIIPAIIRRVTGAGVSHSSLVVRLPYGDQTRRYVIEAVRTGVEFRLLSHCLQKYDGTAIWYGLKHEHECKREGIAAWAFDALGRDTKYDFGGVIGQLWKRAALEAGKLYCSELIDAAYIAADIIEPDPDGARRPGDFVKLGIFDCQAHLLGCQ